MRSARNMINVIFHVQATGGQTLNVDSVRYPRTFRPENRSITPLPAGVSVALRDVLLRQQRAKAGLRLSVAIIDSQLVKIILKGGSADMTQAKESKGASRHIAVDTMGLLLAVVAPSAGIQDRVGVRALLGCVIRRAIRQSLPDGWRPGSCEPSCHTA